MRVPFIVLLLTFLLVGCAGYPPSTSPSAEQRGSADETQSATASGTASSTESSTDDREADAPGVDQQQPAPPERAGARRTPEGQATTGEAESGSRRKPMTIGQLASSVLQDVQPPFALLVSDERPVLLTHDVDFDGFDDVCVLVVKTESSDTLPLSEFSDFSRLYQSGEDAFTTYLQVYRQEAGQLALADRIPLGDKVVFESFGKVMIRPGYQLPVAFSASFQTSAGEETEWAIYYSPWDHSRLTLRDELRRSYYVEDINNDGVLDVVVQERGFEEGTGYETFLTWFRWNGQRFEEFRFANVVRSIRGFLDRSRELLIQEDWDGFVEHAVAPEMLDPVEFRAQAAIEVVKRAFERVSPEAPDESVFAEDADIVQVVFPSVMEDPFGPVDEGRAFPVPTRLVTRDGRTALLQAMIAMMKNPFVGRQYTFVLE